MGYTLSFCKDLTPFSGVSYSVPVNGIIYNSLSYLLLHLLSFRTRFKRVESQTSVEVTSTKVTPLFSVVFRKLIFFSVFHPINSDRLDWLIRIHVCYSGGLASILVLAAGCRNEVFLNFLKSWKQSLGSYLNIGHGLFLPCSYCPFSAILSFSITINSLGFKAHFFEVLTFSITSRMKFTHLCE